jgi:hypothetical protein
MIPISNKDRLEIFRTQVGKNEFSRKDYLDYFKEISAPTASRDLKMGVDEKLLKRKGNKRTTLYCYVK